ncbi:MAG TPA: response regulator [Acidimicrobiia bacterium]|nr:response regulator [Acidimicrobiia bacterium]
MELPSGQTILVIEDHPAIRHLIDVVLDRLPVHLVFAPDGLSGLEAIDAHDPALVLLDLRLPDIDGWEVLEWIRARRSRAELPVLIVTAYGADGDEHRAEASGADGYLTKPFDPGDLREFVTRLLGGCLTG